MHRFLPRPFHRLGRAGALLMETRLAIYDPTGAIPTTFVGEFYGEHEMAVAIKMRDRIGAALAALPGCSDCVALCRYTIADALRDAVRSARRGGMTERELSKRARIPVASLRSFVDGKDISLSRAAAIASALKLSLTRESGNHRPVA